MKSRRPFCESLERRQLLAGDFCLASEPAEQVAAAGTDVGEFRSGADLQGVERPLVIEHLGLIPRTGLIDHREWSIPRFELPLRRIEAFADDLVEERENIVVALRKEQVFSSSPQRRPESTLYLFARQDDGTLIESGSLRIDFTVQRLILTENAILVVGQQHRDRFLDVEPAQTLLMTVSRNDMTQTSTQTIDGLLKSVVEQESRLIVSTFREDQIIPAIYPPPPIRYDVSVFDTSGESPLLVAKDNLPAPVTENMIVGDDIVLVFREPIDAGSDFAGIIPLVIPTPMGFQSIGPIVSPPIVSPPIVSESINTLARYRITGDRIDRVAELGLAARDQVEVEISDDGKTAVVFGRLDDGFSVVESVDRTPNSLVSLIDLSEDQPALFQSISFSASGRPSITEIGLRAVVVANGGGELIVVDTDQTIDLDAESRIKRILLENPPGQELPRIESITEVSPQLYMVTRRTHRVDPETGLLRLQPERDVVIVSLETLAVASQSSVGATALAVVSASDAMPKRIGFETLFGQIEPQTLAVVSIDAAGQLSQQAILELAGTLEIDSDGSRLLSRQVDRIAEYRWDDLENPIVTLLGDPIPGPTAVDDYFVQNAESRDRYLDVLQNDQVVEHPELSAARIVELIGAPEGVTITSGDRLLRLSDSLLNTEGSFQFQYVLQQGSQRATANVELNLFRYNNQDINRTLDRLLETVVEELEVERSEIRVGGQLVYTDRVMPSWFDFGIENPLAGRFGIVVDLAVGDQLYRYSADFGDAVARIDLRQLETVMELQMRAVDAAGNELDAVQIGDEFFIEVIAKDVRPFGLGVFGVSFDLPLPTNRLELTGEIVPLGDFTLFGDPATRRGIDELHAVEVLIEHPGSAPQPTVRIGVRAIAGGEVALQLDPAESIGAELLIRGINHVISSLQVNYGGISLTIEGFEPTDTDASGAVTPTDALRVINFLSRYGSVRVEDLSTLRNEAEGIDDAADVAAMRRLDTNADGHISARDALTVINDLARRFRSAPVEAGVFDDSAGIDFLSDEDDDFETIAV
jgi:hypothetical protein